ncbi:MAG: hypothetical protein J0I86_09265 [Mesorhizobium sp.]|nr:hypothetical protein [Mesorhizobium sp.]
MSGIILGGWKLVHLLIAERAYISTSPEHCRAVTEWIPDSFAYTTFGSLPG